MERNKSSSRINLKLDDVRHSPIANDEISLASLDASRSGPKKAKIFWWKRGNTDYRSLYKTENLRKMTLFHKKPIERSCFIYHDESGVVGTSGVFIVGLLFVKNREPIYQKIKTIRQTLNFKEEMHFSDVSNPKACKVCCEVLSTVLKEPIWFRGYVFDNSKIDLSYFGTHKKKARYTAYNFFTKETLRIFTKNEENAVVYSDKKARAVKDNFIFYVKDSINNNTQPPRTVIKHLQAIDSKTDDIMQIADLIIGAINNKVTGNKHPLKEALRQTAEVEFGKKIRYWEWNFTK